MVAWPCTSTYSRHYPVALRGGQRIFSAGRKKTTTPWRINSTTKPQHTHSQQPRRRDTGERVWLRQLTNRPPPAHAMIYNIICQYWTYCACSEKEGVAQSYFTYGVVNSLEDIFDMIQRWWSSHIVKNDYYLLTRFLFPLSFTVIAVDIAEQVRTQLLYNI